MSRTRRHHSLARLEVAEKLPAWIVGDRLDRVGIGHLAPQRGGRGSVQPPHAILDLAGANQSKTIDRERNHLDVDRSHLTRNGHRMRRLRLRRTRIMVGERELGTQHRHPRRRNTRGLPLYQHRRPLDPTRRLGRPPKRVRVLTELDREPCSSRLIAE